MTKYLKITQKDLKEAAIGINEGKLVLFPTETVYGIGADGLNADAVDKIFKAKGRKTDNPLILHISNLDMVTQIAKDISELEWKLMNEFFPGPFTLILKKKDIVPSIVTGNLDTVGIRMPSNKVAHDLIELSNTPIAAPSANISGRPSGTNIKDIYKELDGKVDYMIDGGNTDIGLESTVVRVINDEIHILRPGAITKEALSKITPKVIVDQHVLKEISNNEEVLSPGMKYKHYAPETKCLLIYAKNNDDFINKVKELELQYPNLLCVCKTKNTSLFKRSIDMGNTNEEISKNIFSILRQVDNYDTDLVVIEGVEPIGLGLAIMNRLIRACSHNYLEI